MPIATPYEDLLRLVLETGTPKADRTGTGTRSVFGHQLRYDLAAGFPLITTKKVHLKSIVYELLWFLRGDSNVGWLQEHGVTIWDEWAERDGDLGPVYGVQWRSWPTPAGEHIDQISAALETAASATPTRGAIIVSAWNVGEIPQMALPPCHAFFQFYVADGKLSLPAVPAQRRPVPRRAVQHRQLRAAHPHDGRAGRPRTSATSSGPAATATSTTTTSSRSPSSSSRDPRPYPELVLAPRIRSSTTPTRTSRSRTTTRTRRSRRRWRYDGPSD